MCWAQYLPCLSPEKISNPFEYLSHLRLERREVHINIIRNLVFSFDFDRRNAFETRYIPARATFFVPRICTFEFMPKANETSKGAS